MTTRTTTPTTREERERWNRGCAPATALREMERLLDDADERDALAAEVASKDAEIARLWETRDEDVAAEAARYHAAEAEVARLAAALRETRDLLADVRVDGWHLDGPNATLKREKGVFERAADALAGSTSALDAALDAALARAREEGRREMEEAILDRYGSTWDEADALRADLAAARRALAAKETP